VTRTVLLVWGGRGVVVMHMPVVNVSSGRHPLTFFKRKV
jgi:hypothetical protein